MRVGVVHDPHGGERTRQQSRLLPELPSRGVLGGLALLEAPPGKLPQTPQQTRVGPPTHQPPVARPERERRRDDQRGRRPRDPSREHRRVWQFLARTARRRDRARGTDGVPREADGLPELHDRLVERARALGGELGGERGAEPLADQGGTDVAPFEGPARGNAKPVRLERDDPHVEGEACHGGCDVLPDARQRSQPFDGRREAPSVLSHEDLGRRVQVAGPRVVTGALPGLQDVFETGRREPLDVREPREEGLVALRDRRNAGLLEHHLGDPQPVRVPVEPPRQRPAVRGEPSEQGPSARPPTGHPRPHGMPDETKH